MYRFNGDCFGLVRHGSGFITVSVSAYGTRRILDCWIYGWIVMQRVVKLIKNVAEE